MEEFGKAQREWLSRLLALPNGIPSHDTFLRVFAKLDPAAFSRAFGRWTAAACGATGLVPGLLKPEVESAGPSK